MIIVHPEDSIVYNTAWPIVSQFERFGRSIPRSYKPRLDIGFTEWDQGMLVAQKA